MDVEPASASRGGADAARASGGGCVRLALALVSASRRRHGLRGAAAGRGTQRIADAAQARARRGRPRRGAEKRHDRAATAAGTRARAACPRAADAMGQLARPHRGAGAQGRCHGPVAALRVELWPERGRGAACAVVWLASECPRARAEGTRPQAVAHDGSRPRNR
eukprot:1787505-Prymnesium_polylepis.1